MQLHYHHRLFDLISEVPQKHELAPLWIKSLEHELGARVPASVREWLSIQDCELLLRKYSNDDHPIALADLSRRYLEHAALRFNSLVEHSLLQLLTENQGVFLWAVKLDDRLEDPPVYVRWNEKGAFWYLAAIRFSDFIYGWIWNYQLIFPYDRYDSPTKYIITGHSSQFSELIASQIRNYLPSEIVTGIIPGRTDHRFQMDDQHLLVVSEDVTSTWYLAASSKDSLYDLGQLVQKVTPLKFSVAPPSTGDGVDDVIQQLLNSDT